MRGDCGCRNHLGKQKVKHASREAAVDTIIRRHLRHGPHEPYECPHMENVWHVRSIRPLDRQ
jgi:hypothetical protein